MEAIVALPPHVETRTGRRYTARYHVPGFGATVPSVFGDVVRWRQARIEANYSEMVLVVLPAMISSGHHLFADSANNGPWGRALVEELIPYLESQLPLQPVPRARLLSGHSSGGWSALWLQISHPDVFGGTWSTAPDPVDFRNFSTVDATPGSTDNLYRTRDGNQRVAVRLPGGVTYSMEDCVRLETVRGTVGEFGTFDWAFSPRGDAGRPMPLFDRATGDQNPDVQRAWKRFDIHEVLESTWGAIGSKVGDKLHLFAGDQDTFFLDQSLRLLCDFLKSKRSRATCEIVQGKNHFDLLGESSDPGSLAARIEREMDAVTRVR